MVDRVDDLELLDVLVVDLLVAAFLKGFPLKLTFCREICVPIRVEPCWAVTLLFFILVFLLRLLLDIAKQIILSPE